MRVPGIPYVQGRNAYTDRDGRKFGIAIHNTSNDASDSAEASFATRRTDGVSAHFYVDGDSVTQSVDTRDRVGHAGSQEGNDNAIAVEITGANGWTRQQWLTGVAWDLLGRVLAQVIRHHWPDGSFAVRRASVAEMRANPKVKALYGHDDMRRAWGGTTHTDPGPSFPWDRLTGAINAALRPAVPALPEEDDMPTIADILAADVVEGDGAYPLGRTVWEARQHAMAANTRTARMEAMLTAMATQLGVVAADVDQVEELAAANLDAVRAGVAQILAAITADPDNDIVLTDAQITDLAARLAPVLTATPVQVAPDSVAAIADASARATIAEIAD